MDHRTLYLRLAFFLSFSNIISKIRTIAQSAFGVEVYALLLVFSIMTTILIGTAHYLRDNKKLSQKLMCVIGIIMFYIRSIVMLIPFPKIMHYTGDTQETFENMLDLYKELLSTVLPNMMLATSLLSAAKELRNQRTDSWIQRLIVMLTSIIIPMYLITYVIAYQAIWIGYRLTNNTGWAVNNIFGLVLNLSLAIIIPYLLYYVCGIWNNKIVVWIGRILLTIVVIEIIIVADLLGHLNWTIDVYVNIYCSNFLNSVIFEDFLEILFATEIIPTPTPVAELALLSSTNNV